MKFIEFYNKYKPIIDKGIIDFFNNQTADPYIKDYYALIRSYLFGGKRLRPLSVMMSFFGSNGRDIKDIVLPAIAVEIHHAYHLIIDDVFDEDSYRRNQKSIHKQVLETFLSKYKDISYKGDLFSRKSSRFAASIAILLGNMAELLSSKAIEQSSASSELKCKTLNLIQETELSILQGQMMDMLMEYEEATKDQYLRMVELKTALLFGLAFELGALYAGSENTGLFRDFGTKAAISFQIQDDIIDITGRKGHMLGTDIKLGKRTLLLLKTLELTYDKAIINDVLGNQDASIEDIKKVIKIMQESGAVDYCKRLAAQKNVEAKEIIDKLGLSKEYKQLFSEFTDFMLYRYY